MRITNGLTIVWTGEREPGAELVRFGLACDCGQRGVAGGSPQSGCGSHGAGRRDEVVCTGTVISGSVHVKIRSSRGKPARLALAGKHLDASVDLVGMAENGLFRDARTASTAGSSSGMRPGTLPAATAPPNPYLYTAWNPNSVPKVQVIANCRWVTCP